MLIYGNFTSLIIAFRSSLLELVLELVLQKMIAIHQS